MGVQFVRPDAASQSCCRGRIRCRWGCRCQCSGCAAYPGSVIAKTEETCGIGLAWQQRYPTTLSVAYADRNEMTRDLTVHHLRHNMQQQWIR
jgi:hypothetical protein